MTTRPMRVIHGVALGFALIASLPGQETDQASKIYSDASKSVFLLIVKSAAGEPVSQGTGFLVQGGKIVTNEHVVRDGNVFIDLGAVRLPLKIERLDVFNDLALLSASAELAQKPLAISNATPKPGTSIYTIGNPAGLERSISTGVVSGIREIKGRQLLQVSSPISPGSSGGPVLNGGGEVVGVTVGMLEQGQNLNFAVPSVLVAKLLKGEVIVDANVDFLIERANSLLTTQKQYQYSADADSDYQKVDRQIDELLQTALDRAGNDYGLLLKVAAKAQIQNIDIAISAAQRAVRAKPTVEANYSLGKSLKIKALFADASEKPGLLDQSEKAIRSAIQSSKHPSGDMYFQLADVLEDRGLLVESEAYFRHALMSARADSDQELQANSVRGLIRVEDSLGRIKETATLFSTLVGSGQASALDWQNNGLRLDKQELYKEGAESYRQAALLGGEWDNWCKAATRYSLVNGAEDSLLESARKCISEGVGKEDSEKLLSAAHQEIATVLNDRGVYQEGLSHAREAVVLNSSNAWNFAVQAKSLIGLRRFQEAINASNQAIRLSDGKFSDMHFDLGFAYFAVENWEFAKGSFGKAAQLDPKDAVSAYNMALCLARLGYSLDAAHWFEEVLRRNPNHPDKQSILSRIQALRR